MKIATVRTLRNDYAQLLRRVETGEEIEISRRGKVVARLVPALRPAPPISWAGGAGRKLAATISPLQPGESQKLRADSQGQG